jgi:hypothetical protein
LLIGTAIVAPRTSVSGFLGENLAELFDDIL